MIKRGKVLHEISFMHRVKKQFQKIFFHPRFPLDSSSYDGLAEWQVLS